MKWLVCALLATTWFATAAFVPPAEGPIPFRRDRLPVDVDTMKMLSEQLALMVGSPDLERPGEARHAAQILGLALALDPGNKPARERLQQLSRGQALEAVAMERSRQAKSRAWHLVGWLEQPEAGADGNALAACLVDVLAKGDPEHPRAQKMVKGEEAGAWEGWIAGLEDFKDVEPVALVEETMPPAAEDPESEKAAIRLERATVEVPMWTMDPKTSKPVFGIRAVQVAARIEGEAPKLLVELPGRELASLNGKATAAVRAFLEQRHPDLPKGLHLRFTLEEGALYSEGLNGGLILGAFAVLADAVLSGTPPEALVLAELDSSGGLAVPPRCWQVLRELVQIEDGYRLVLPLAAKEFMPPLITLDESEFFFRHEVLLAEDVEDLCDLASSSPPESLVEAHQAFEVIRQARGTRSLGSFLNRSSTQQRLRQVFTMLPGHVSARMLALRGTSQWPQRLSRELYAREVRAALEPFRPEFRRGGWGSLSAEEWELKADTCSEHLDRVERLFESVKDRDELHAPAADLAKALGKLADAAKRDIPGSPGRYRLEKPFRETWVEFNEVMETLTVEVGDGDEYPALRKAPKMDK